MRLSLLRAAGLAFACAAVPVAAAGAGEPPVVAASIKPLQLLARPVMQGVGEPQLLVPPGASPHVYALKPSEARLLGRADLILWIGPSLEGFLAKPLRTHGRKARVLAFAEAEGLVLLRARGGHDHHDHGEEKHGHDRHGHDKEEHGRHDGEERDHDRHGKEEHGHDRHDGEEHGHDEAHGDVDPHIWLDPENGRRISRLIAAELARLDPERAGVYAANLAAALAGIDRAEAEIRAALAPVRDRRFVVFHDAWQYFEARFATMPAIPVAIDPQRPPGARRAGEIRALVRDGGVRCVLAEPQFEPALLRALVRGTEARVGAIDPLGVEAADYGGLLRAVARGIVECLGP